MRLEGWHLIILFCLVLVPAVLVGLALMAAAARRRTGVRTATGSPLDPSGGDQGTGPGKEQRLRELDDLRRREVIGEDEYRQARQRILGS